MAKDPAFLFYTSDFLSGVSDLTMEERGQYITLLCLQHQKGHLSSKVINLCVGNATADVLHKFSIDDDGLYFSPRLDIEIAKRVEHSQKQRKRALDGWEKRKATADATALPLENENEDVNKSFKHISTTTAITYSIEKAIEICLRDLEWIDATSENCNLDKDKFQYALNDFKKNCISIGRNEDRTLFEFKSHFVNWVKIKKTLKAKETVKDRL